MPAAAKPATNNDVAKTEGQVPAGQLTIWQKLGRVQSTIGEAAKTGHHPQQNFAYIEEHGVIELLRPFMRLYDFAVLVETADQVTVETKVPFGKQGAPATLVTLRGSVEMIDGPTGQSVKKWYAGQGVDTQDKASNKAQTYLTKYALQKFFLIPTQHIDDEGQGVVVEVGDPHAAPAAAAAPGGQAPAVPAAGGETVGLEKAQKAIEVMGREVQAGRLDPNKAKAKVGTFRVPWSVEGLASLTPAQHLELAEWVGREIARSEQPPPA